MEEDHRTASIYLFGHVAGRDGKTGYHQVSWSYQGEADDE